MSVRVSEEISGKTEGIRFLRAELQSYDNKKLLNELSTLNDRERKLKVRILFYLREIDRRRLHLELGFSSMFDFCTNYLRYSRSAACRRIRAARCMGRFPEIALMLQAGELSVSTAALASGIINPGNKREILNRLRCRSYREAEEELARFRPVRRSPERVRPVFTLKPVKRETGESTPDVGSGEKSVDAASGSKTSSDNKNQSERVEVEKEFRLQFMVSEKTMKKINRAKSLLSTRYPRGINLELLFEELLDEYLDNNDPERKVINNNSQSNKSDRNHNTRTRHIPHKVKAQVYKRDGGRCSFVGRSGRRCNSTWNLQYDHIVPFGKGGDNSPENLRLLCARHNRLMAEREYGKKHIESCRSREP
mgnify:CR=1 FL=1